MILALLLMLAVPITVMEETIEVPAAGWRAFDLQLRQKPALLDCRFTVVSGGSGVRVALMDRADLERLRAGEGQRPLAASAYVRTGEFRIHVPAGEYSLVIGNELEGRGPARVQVKVSLVFPGVQPQARVLSPQRRAVIVSASLLFLFGLSLFAGRRILSAWSRRGDTPPPPFWI